MRRPASVVLIPVAAIVASVLSWAPAGARPDARARAAASDGTWTCTATPGDTRTKPDTCIVLDDGTNVTATLTIHLRGTACGPTPPPGGKCVEAFSLAATGGGGASLIRGCDTPGGTRGDHGTVWWRDQDVAETVVCKLGWTHASMPASAPGQPMVWGLEYLADGTVGMKHSADARLVTGPVHEPKPTLKVGIKVKLVSALPPGKGRSVSIPVAVKLRNAGKTPEQKIQIRAVNVRGGSVRRVPTVATKLPVVVGSLAAGQSKTRTILLKARNPGHYAASIDVYFEQDGRGWGAGGEARFAVTH